MLIYGGSANRIATALLVEKEEAKILLEKYFKKFSELELYIENTSTLARYQGWVKCPATNRIYFVNESNSKGDDSHLAASRKACNSIVL